MRFLNICSWIWVVLGAVAFYDNKELYGLGCFIMSMLLCIQETLNEIAKGKN